MSTAKKSSLDPSEIPSALANYLGVRRTMTLRRIMRQSGLPMEVVLDLALELLDIASRKLAPTGKAKNSASSASFMRPRFTGSL